LCLLVNIHHSEEVVAVPADENVGLAPPGAQFVVPLNAEDVAVSLDLVVAIIAVQNVVAKLPIDEVVAGTPKRWSLPEGRRSCTTRRCPRVESAVERRCPSQPAQRS